MFDAEKAQKIEEKRETPRTVQDMELTELLDLRAQIDARLPPRKLADISLEEELMLQFHVTRDMMNTVLNDSTVPANQKAQVANSCSAVLTQITKLQQELYTSERIKAIENALIKVVRTWPEPLQVQFFNEYERAYQGGRT